MIKIVKNILKIFDNYELWDEGVELIGSWCFELYQKNFNVRKYPLKTVDIDFLVPYPYRGRTKVNLVEKFEQIGFRVNFNSDGSFYLTNGEMRIDFLSPELGRSCDKVFLIKNLSLKTIPLRYMDILLKDKVSIKEGDLNISIPSPLNFSLHKLLIAQRRKDKSKKIKDIEQAIFTLEVVDPEKFKDEFLKLPNKAKRYILKSLEEAKEHMPLQEEFIRNIILTLQNN